jgi:hypothetical protein
VNARARTARRTRRDRTRTQRATARITRTGTASLTTHAIAAGLPAREARSVAGSLRNAAKKLAITGTPHRVHAGRRMRDARHYTPQQVAAMCTVYRPRKPAYRDVAARLALAA